jgi:hypothetical protein
VKSLWKLYSPELGCCIGFHYPSKDVDSETIGQILSEDHPMNLIEDGTAIPIAIGCISHWSRNGRPYLWLGTRATPEKIAGIVGRDAMLVRHDGGEAGPVSSGGPALSVMSPHGETVYDCECEARAGWAYPGVVATR